MALLVVGSPAANAFGSEVLGCSFDSGAWTANSCAGGGEQGVVYQIHFSAHNLSGTYSKRWTVYQYQAGMSQPPPGVVITPTTCTSTSTTCTVSLKSNAFQTKTISADLQLTQSGQTRDIWAYATVYPVCSSPDSC
ncbi:hypothetical protein [Jatrophihabitans sp.]|uniref:hypothetical protein n=1 Tax=Jatrophihabitans sp. TaxID=1932789 RepID=UPI002CD7DA5D|nr:hypothetical protein [Jatrophihabitans sp.]